MNERNTYFYKFLVFFVDIFVGFIHMGSFPLYNTIFFNW